jgi:tetratricopeptide (TPR) repeat protein
MKTIYFLLSFLYSFVIYSQQATDDNFIRLFEENKFDSVIVLKQTINEDDISANSLYVIGIAYYDKGNQSEAIKYLDKAINKGPEESKMYYFIAQSYKELKQYDKALSYINKAIIKFPQKPAYPADKAEIYFELGKDAEAVNILKEAIQNGNTSGKTYYLLADYYYNKDKNTKAALEILYSGKDLINVEDEHYRIILYNIYLMEFESGEFTRSLNYIKELISTEPNNYKLYQPVIQNYFALQMYDSAAHYQKKLYEAQKDGKLEGKLTKEYCFERFKWNEKWVYAFEDYYVPNPEKDFAFHKQIYVVYDKNWKEEFTIQTELFLTFKSESDIIYVLGAGKYEGDEYLHQTYSTLAFKEPVDYKKLKESVMLVLEGKVTPVTQSKSKKKK